MSQVVLLPTSSAVTKVTAVPIRTYHYHDTGVNKRTVNRGNTPTTMRVVGPILRPRVFLDT